MTYRISGLDPAPFAPLFGRDAADLAQLDARRIAVTAYPGAPCRVTLDDAQPGEQVLLLNHLSVPSGPFRASHAIFVTEGATSAACFDDTVPPALDRRVLSLRAFDQRFDMIDAALVQPGEADMVIRRLLGHRSVVTVHAHYATRGCFAARVERT